MNNDIVNESIPQKFKKLSFFGCIIFCALAALLSILAGVSPFSMTLTALSAATYAFLFLSTNNKVIGFIPVPFSFVALFFTSMQLLLNIITVLSPVLIGASAAYCISKKKPVFNCIASCSAATLISMICSFTAGIYLTYGSVIKGFSTYIDLLKPQITEAFLNVFEIIKENNQLDVTLSTSDIDSLIRQVAIIMPSCLVIIAEMLSALTFFGAVLLLKRRSRIKYFYSDRLNFTLSVSTSIFFMISGIGAFLFSLANSTMFIAYSFINACAILIIPMTIQGILTLTKSLKTPVMISKDGSLPIPNKRPAAITTTILTAISLFVSPILSLFLLSYYGAYITLSDTVFEKLKNKTK